MNNYAILWIVAMVALTVVELCTFNMITIWFVIGGAAIYTLLEPYCKKAYITKVDADGEAEKFIPNLDEMDNWKCVSTSEVKEHNGLTFTFNEYENTDVKSL